MAAGSSLSLGAINQVSDFYLSLFYYDCFAKTKFSTRFKKCLRARSPSHSWNANQPVFARIVKMKEEERGEGSRKRERGARGERVLDFYHCRFSLVMPEHVWFVGRTYFQFEHTSRVS